MSRHELAQLNVAHLAAPLESPQLADFVASLDRINELADGSPGFVWRLQTEEGDATGIRDFGDDFIVNMSVWRDLESLHDFVYRSAHAAVMARRREWFETMRSAYAVLWWVPAGHRPSVAEAKARLEALQSNGPTRHAFTFKHAFPPPDDGRTSSPLSLGDPCPAV